jgi:hypothetical protein
MRLDEIPMPPAVAVRPRDVRGYPVLAITPWHQGTPAFGLTSTERVLICAVERRCAVCGTPMDAGPVWRVVGAEEAVAIGAAGTSPRVSEYANAAATVEPPGHQACMLYASMACPFLARPNARRGGDASIGDFSAARGDARGELDGIGGAVVAFGTYEFRLTDFVTFRFSRLVTYAPHGLGDEHLPALREAIAAEIAAGPRDPWRYDDEAAAVERAARYR